MEKKYPMVSLGEVCKIEWGNTKLTKSSYVKDGKYLAVSAAGFDGRIDHYEHEKNTPVLSAIGAQCGKMFLAKERFTAIKNTITFKKINKSLNSIYLFYFLNNFNFSKRGGAQPFIAKTYLKQIQIPLPPLDIQEEIVYEIEKQFSLIRDLKERLLKQKSFLEEYQKAYMESLIDPKWEKKSLAGGGCDLMNGFAFKSSSFTKEGVPVIRISNIQKGKIVLSDVKRIKQNPEFEKFLIQKGDLLIAMSGATTGKMGIYLGSEKCYQNQRVGNLKIIEKNSITEEYRNYSVMSLKDLMLKKSYGVAQPNISKKQIEELIIPLPPLEIQKEIVKKIESKTDLIQKSLKNIDSNLGLLKEYESLFLNKLLNQNEEERKAA